MDTRKLVVTAMAVLCLALTACGSDGEGSDSSRPSITLPERSTTVPDETDSTDEATGTTEDAQGPTTETPTTETPTTDTPTTDTPTTETPTTETPTTRPPVTRPSTTESPTTETPTTETPATETPTTAPVDPEAISDESTPWWPWVLAGLVIIGLIAFLVSRRSGTGATWKQQTAAAFDEATRIATHLAAVAPDGAAMVAAQDAGQLATLAATLSTRAAETTDQQARLAIVSVRDQVQVLHGVVDGMTMSTAPVTPAALGYLKEQAMALHGATARARAELFPPPPSPGAGPA